MSTENVMDFFTTLGFEETDIEDGLTALFFELNSDGSYALITDESGSIPISVEQSLVFACYSSEGAYLWSASFKNAELFKSLWLKPATLDQKLTTIKEYRESNETF